MTFGNGLVESREYNNRLQLTRLKTLDNGLPTVADWVYNYLDAAGKNNGRLQSMSDNTDSSQSAWYGYDQLNRLSWYKRGSETVPLSHLTYSYDAYGNRLSQHVQSGSGPEMNLTYDNNNRITTANYVYDPNGNLKQTCLRVARERRSNIR